VAALRPLYEQRIDRMIINVQNSITSAGGNGLEVLARSPGIDVNEINQVISINGRSGVQILINGRLSRLPMSAIMEMLRSTDASNIDKIEIYETPPAHLDAEGNGGVINIILVKSKDYGTNGSYSLNAGYGRRFKYGASIKLNHRTEKLNLYSSYSLSHRFTRDYYRFDRIVNQQGNLIDTDSRNDRDGESLRNSGEIGLDYSITKKTIIGFLASGYLADIEVISDNTSTFSQNDLPFSIIENENKETEKQKYGLLNLNVQHHISEKSTINFDVDHLQYRSDNPSNYVNNFFDGNQNMTGQSETIIASKTPIKNWSAKVDYNKNFTDDLSFQFGLKATTSRFNNVVEARERQGSDFVILENFSQHYDLEENIAAAYSSIDFQLDDKTSMNIGLRYEFTDYLLTTPDNPVFLDREFGYLFPSFFISRNINETNQFQLSYSRRITRPAFYELAPFVTFIDPNTFFIGNPRLLPGISNNIKTSYKLKSILFSLSYGYSQDPIKVYQPVIDPETNTQFLTTLNLDKEHSFSMSLLIPLHPTSWWDIQNKVSGDIERLIVEKEDEAINLDTRAFALNVINTFKLPKGFSLEIAGQYKTTGYYGLLEVQPRGYLNVGLQKKFADGNLRLNASDIFHTNIWKSDTTIPELGLDNQLVVDVETRVIFLTYTSNFGKSSVKGKRRRETSSEEEQLRIW
jgi:outer membrane receptor protein involved in Fe transport